MAQLAYLVAIVSTALRITGYLFLRVIPSRYLTIALATFYGLYLSSLYLVGYTPSQHTSQGSNGERARAESKADKEEVITAHLEARRQPRMNIARTILLSLPSSSRLLTLLNVAINTLVVLLAIDCIVYPVLDNAKDVAFTRIGAVYPDSVKLVVRYPALNATRSSIRILWRQVTSVPESSWNAGPAVTLTVENDWVNTTRLNGLWPSTAYEYVLGDHDYTPLPYPVAPIQFHTFPDPRLSSGAHFRFVVSSCATPNFPYLPFHGRRIKGFDLLADYLWSVQPESPSPAHPTQDLVMESPVSSKVIAAEPIVQNVSSIADVPPVEFMLFLGDFIYADVPMYFGDDPEAYRRLYRRNYQSDSFRRVYEHLPMFHTYDDHEIINNFVGEGNDSTPPFANAADAFRLYNADANFDPLEPEQHYYDFRFADVAFFVMDTRRYRSDITKVDEMPRTMLGDKQLAALYEWLGKVNTTAAFKFIVTSVPFTSLWQHDAKEDSWAAYPYEKMSLQNALHSVPNVILLSGDRHEFAAIKFNAEGAGHSIMEVSTSPLIKTLKEVMKDVDGTSVTAFEAEEVPQEQVVKYIAEGNYKWSAFEVDTRDPQHPVAHLEVMVDGNSAYKLAIIGKPVVTQHTSALGDLVPTGFRGVLDRMGLRPSRWFS